MREVGIEELKKIQIEILDAVADYCDKSGIQYWLDCGTLLGAIRHKGYIPWDDDIDIGMLREDYDRFVNSFHDSSGRYRVCTMYNSKKFPFAFAKVMDTKTELYEPSKKAGIKLSINIDVFPYDNAPEDSQTVKEMYDERDKAIIWYRRRILPGWTAGSPLKKAIRNACCQLLRVIPTKYFIDRIDRNCRRFQNEETPFLGHFIADLRMLVRKSAVASFVDVEFEGKYYHAPVGYDMWLKAGYGDYMQLPPEEKRVSKHHFEAYIDTTE